MTISRDALEYDRQAWQEAVAQVLQNIPQRASGDDAARMADALRSVASLMGRLSAKGAADGAAERAVA